MESSSTPTSTTTSTIDQDKLINELHSFIVESEQREKETLDEVRNIHEAIANMIESAKLAAIDRNEAVVKITRKTARISDKAMKIMMGTGLLLIVTVVAIVYSDPRDLADTLRRFMPAVGAAWFGLIAFLLYDQKPSEPHSGLKNEPDQRDSRGS
jgi:hypothetical protein